MRTPSLLAAVLVATLLSACASAINLKNAERYHDAGLRAEFAGNYPAAREAFRRSLQNARTGGATPTFISGVTYNLGRMTGYVCDFAQAKELLLESLRLEEALPAPNRGNVTKRLAELARLAFAEGKFSDSASFYERGVAELVGLGMPSDDPLGFAVFLDGFAEALVAGGQAARAREVQSRAELLRSRNQGRRAGFVPTYYHVVCASKRV